MKFHDAHLWTKPMLPHWVVSCTAILILRRLKRNTFFKNYAYESVIARQPSVKSFAGNEER